LQKKHTTSKRKYKDIQEEIKEVQNNVLCFKVESKNHYTKGHNTFSFLPQVSPMGTSFETMRKIVNNPKN
jgi:hypothetical protein